MTQYFTVVETQTGKKGVQVPREKTVADVRAILEGKVDSLQPEDLLYIATLQDVENKLSQQKPTPMQQDENQSQTPQENAPNAKSQPNQ